MQIPMQKIEESAGNKHDPREYLQDIWLDIDHSRNFTQDFNQAISRGHNRIDAYGEAKAGDYKGQLVATDGHILALVPVTCDIGDTTGPVSVDVLKQARKVCKGQEFSPGCIKANGGLQIRNGGSFPREDKGRYPDYQRIIPDKPERDPDVILDAGLLFKLAKSIVENPRRDTYGVKIWINDHENGAYYVEPHKGGDTYGVIMGMRK